MLGRRTHHRYSIQWPVVVHHQGVPYECTTRDIGLGGLFVVCAEPIPFEAKVEVELQLPDLKQPTRVASVVRWCGAGGYGLQFRGLALRALDTWALNRLLRSEHASMIDSVPPPIAV